MKVQWKRILSIFLVGVILVCSDGIAYAASESNEEQNVETYDAEATVEETKESEQAENIEQTEEVEEEVEEQTEEKTEDTQEEPEEPEEVEKIEDTQSEAITQQEETAEKTVEESTEIPSLGVTQLSASTLLLVESRYNYVKLQWNGITLPDTLDCGYYLYSKVDNVEKIIAEVDKTATGYEIYSYTNDIKNATPDATLANTVTSFSYQVNNIIHNKNYQFRVAAFKDRNTQEELGVSSNLISTTPKLQTPVMVSVAGKNYNTAILTWTATADKENQYIIYRKASTEADYKKIATVSGCTYKDTTLIPGIKYSYKIQGAKTITTSDIAYSGLSSAKSVKVKPTQTTVTTISNSYNSMKVTWKKVKGTEKDGYVTGYAIYRSTSKNGTYSKITTAAGGTGKYIDTKLKTGKTYYYKIRAYCTISGKKVYSEYSNISGTKVIPKAATVSSVKSAGYNSLTISWKKVSGANGYGIYRSTSKNGTYKKIKKIKNVNTQTYTDTKLKTGKTYYYKVKAYTNVKKTAVYGFYSNVKSAKPIPAKVKGLTVTIKNDNKLKLTWKKVSGAKTYRIYRSTSKNGTYKVIKKNCKNTYYTNSSLKSGKKYYYKVAAIRGDVSGKLSGYTAAKAAKLKIGTTAATVQVGATQKISAKASPKAKIKWSSSNTNVVTVNSSGTITGKSVGSAKIYAKANGITCTVKVQVKQTLNGIDVSKWQGDIDFSAVKNAGYDFVMIRVYNGFCVDPYFETNYANAKAAGLKVGVYYYTYAKTMQEAQQDAFIVLNLLDGRSLEYPVVIDAEDNSLLDGLTNEDRTNIIWTFCETIQNNSSYKPALYANLQWLNNYLDNWRLAGLKIWIARWRDPSLGHGYTGAGDIFMWQYTSDGSVPGIAGRVDLNFKF